MISAEVKGSLVVSCGVTVAGTCDEWECLQIKLCVTESCETVSISYLTTAWSLVSLGARKVIG